MSESLRDLLRQGADDVERPQLDVGDLVAQAQRRLVRRRFTAATASAAAVVLITAGGFALQSDKGRTEPAPASPSETSPTAAEWTPERIRREGSPGDSQGTIPATQSGLATRLYQVCDGTRCDPDDGAPEDLRVALEVSQDGRSAVFDLDYSIQPWVRAFDEDSVLVQDGEVGQPDAPVRYRLLQADGTAVALQMIEDPASPVPEPGMVVIDDWSAWNFGMAAETVYLIDDLAGTLQPVDTPAEVRYWGPNPHEFLWGVADDCRVFWATGGKFEEHQLDCAGNLDFAFGISAEEFPPAWLQPGRMAVLEQTDDGQRKDQTFVHVSIDYGVSWQRVPVADGESTTEVLRQVG